MSWFRRRSRDPLPVPPRRPVADRPDVEKARADLVRLKARRHDVDQVVAALMIEQHLNSFSANLTATFRGGRP